MKNHLLVAVALFPLLYSCAPPRPEIPMTDVPAAPLVREIADRRASFTGLKAVARAETVRNGRKRAYESVSILLEGQSKLRIEGYGPMGGSLFALLWDGKDLVLRRPGEADFIRPGQWAFERLIGFPLEPSELAAVLSGNAPSDGEREAAQARCSAEGWCVVEFRRDEARWKVRVVPADRFRIESWERFQGNELVYETRFEAQELVGEYLFPKRVVVQNQNRHAALTVEYEEVEINVPLDEEAFTITSGGGAVR